ncbi:MAG: hypothetical protein JO250_03800 [Armatimonadetes bacterium]|nr:hypothetical protein [Armatimonadota bacterium]
MNSPETGFVREAKEEIARRAREGSLVMPTDAVSSLRLLVEFFFLALYRSHGVNDFRGKVEVEPKSFAEVMIMIAFADWMRPSSHWPFTQEQMRSGLAAAGLRGDLLDAYNFDAFNEDTALLIGAGKYEYKWVQFNPRPDQLWLTESPQARATATISGGDQSFSTEIAVLYDGSRLETTTSTNAGETTVERSVSLRHPYRSNKEQEELAAGRVFISAYNAASGTNYTVWKSPRERDSVDLLAGPRSWRKPTPLRIQVCTCNPENARRLMNKQSSYFDKADPNAIRSELLGAVRAKAEKYPVAERRRLILLIDGGWISPDQGAIETIMADYIGELRATEFQEIWYASHLSGKAFPLIRNGVEAQGDNNGDQQ